MENVDYIIVGQGFAGSFFAFELLKNKQSFILIDHFQLNASHIAAGVYNPVVLKRFAPIWNAHNQIEFLEKKTLELESFLSISLLNPHSVARIFHDEEEKQIWLNKANNKEINPFLNSQILEKPSNITAPFGMGLVNKSGRIDAPLLIEKFRNYLIKNNRLLNNSFQHTQLQCLSTGFQYGTIQAAKIVFAEGMGVAHNPFFNYLPIYPNKGECLEVHIEAPLEDYIYKKKSFLFARAPHTFYVGGSYSLTELSQQPTSTVRKTLLSEAAEIYSGKMEVMKHQFAFRPVTQDRRPMVGEHPHYKNMFLLNGLGTRGSILGAYFAHQLFQSIENLQPIEKEADIQRYSHRFSSGKYF